MTPSGIISRKGRYAITFRADSQETLLERLFRLKWRIALISAQVLALVILGLSVIGWRWAFHDLPEAPQSADALWDVRREAAVTVLAADGTVLGQRGPLYGQPARLENLPDHVSQAFLAIEDRRYFEHDGFDERGFARAMLTNLRAGRLVQGGSTLTMQLVKNLILSPERTPRRKIQEIRLALALENRLSKQEILELYLNRIYLGEQAFGIEAASQRYFNKSASALSVSEAALLAGLPKAPSRLAPTVNLEGAQARALLVLAAMRDAGYLTEDAYQSAVETPAVVVESETTPDWQTYGHVFDMAVTEAQAALGADALTPDLVIQTSLDLNAQAAAQSAVDAVMDLQGEARQAGEAALVAMHPNGRIVALIGGRDYGQSQFNRATQSRRQPGSAFKPVVFAAGFEVGLEPSTAFEDAPIEIEGWSPENYGGGYRGRITIADALKRSINTVAAQVGTQVGPQTVVDMAQRLGVTTPLDPVPSLALGASGVPLLDMTRVYAVFANDGRRPDPVLVTEIRNSRGDVLWTAPNASLGPQVIERDQARWMSTMLQSVISDGTGRRAQVDGHRTAGKTGTSQNSRDAWFMGYSGHLVAGVWVGNDDDTPTDNVTGGQLPAEIWRRFISQSHQGLTAAQLSAPAPRRRGAREETLAAYYSELSARFESLRDGVEVPPAPRSPKG